MLSNKKFLKIIFITIVFLFYLLTINLDLSASTVATEKMVNYSNEVCCYSDQIILENNQFHFQNDEVIELHYSLDGDKNIKEINYETNGFSNVSISRTSSLTNNFSVVFNVILNANEYYLTITVVLDNNKELYTNIYAISNQYGTFISTDSEDNAREHYYSYAIVNNILSYDECLKIRKQNDLLCFVQKNEEVACINDINTYEINATTTLSINGMFSWKDDSDNIHPLRRVKVELWYPSVTPSRLVVDTEMTNDSGEFNFSIDNNESIINLINNGLLQIRLYPGDGNATIVREVTNEQGTLVYEEYYKDIIVTLDENGVLNPIAEIILMNDCIGQSFQIMQAVLTGQAYAEEMMDEIPAPITVRYPYGSGCSYNPSNKYMNLTSNFFDKDAFLFLHASWDVILHEYGHHLQYIIDITNNPAGYHYSNFNDIDYLENKESGICLAWGESWPTVFGLVSQNYFSTYLTNIDTTLDTFYTAYNGLNYDLECASIYLGEGCERSIMAILWDIFDDTNETNDLISLGHQAFWDVVDESNATTLSEFIQYFYQQYPQYKDDLGCNLSFYNVASSIPTLINFNSISQTVPPTISWKAQGGSTRCPNNSFQIVFYDFYGREVYRTEEIVAGSEDTKDTIFTYTLTTDDWHSVLYSYGNSYRVAIASKQTDQIITGEYISGWTELYNKPKPENLSNTITLNSWDKYVERVVELQPGQYIDYSISFPTSGIKLIQTFGPNDTMIYLYDSNNMLLEVVEDVDDAGYQNNSLISHNVTANTQYIIRVKFCFEEHYGKIKLGITHAYANTTSGTEINDYDDIYVINECTEYTTVAEPNCTRVVVFSPPSDGRYLIEIESGYDTFIYIIDPRSTELLKFNIEYADYGYIDDEGNASEDPYIIPTLEAGVPYLIVYSVYNPSALEETINLTIKISEYEL